METPAQDDEEESQQTRTSLSRSRESGSEEDSRRQAASRYLKPWVAPLAATCY
jgi:hypothetical protein